MPIHLRAEAGDYADACLLPGDPLRAKYIAETYLTDAVQVNGERGLLGYTGTWEGKRVSVQGTGMGCPGATIVFEELIQLGVDPMIRDPEGFRWRTRAQIEEGRSWIWVEDGLIHFKAEASAWTPSAVQLQQVWVDPPVRRNGYAKRALRDLCRELLNQVPVVCLFVRAENVAATRLYESIGMEHVLDYRSLLL